MIDKAVKLAATVHEGQIDKGGEAYILHPIAVMELVRKQYGDSPYIEELMCTALLHDVIEDFKGEKVSKLELIHEINLTFGPRVLEALVCLTKERGQAYDEYIEHVSHNFYATVVKIADLTHNMDVTRLPSKDIDRVDYERWDKYRKALVRLKRG